MPALVRTAAVAWKRRAWRAEQEASALRSQLAEAYRRIKRDTLTPLVTLKCPEVRIEWERLFAIHGGALIRLDADGFKGINDRYGHDIGDVVITGIGEHLAANFRRGGVGAFGWEETAARDGGDEFSIFAPGVLDPDPILTRLEGAFRGFAVLHGSTWIPVSMSWGCCSAAPGEMEFSRLLLEADRALYRARGIEIEQ